MSDALRLAAERAGSPVAPLTAEVPAIDAGAARVDQAARPCLGCFCEIPGMVWGYVKAAATWVYTSRVVQAVVTFVKSWFCCCCTTKAEEPAAALDAQARAAAEVVRARHAEGPRKRVAFLPLRKMTETFKESAKHVQLAILHDMFAEAKEEGAEPLTTKAIVEQLALVKDKDVNQALNTFLIGEGKAKGWTIGDTEEGQYIQFMRNGTGLDEVGDDTAKRGPVVREILETAVARVLVAAEAKVRPAPAPAAAAAAEAGAADEAAARGPLGSLEDLAKDAAGGIVAAGEGLKNAAAVLFLPADGSGAGSAASALDVEAI